MTNVVLTSVPGLGVPGHYDSLDHQWLSHVKPKLPVSAFKSLLNWFLYMRYAWMPDTSLIYPEDDRPEVFIVDTKTLRNLAQANALHLLHQVGYRVAVPDIVAIQATDSLDEPYTRVIKDWFDVGTAPGSLAPVRISPTWIGRAFVAARRGVPDFQWPNACELIIPSWLYDSILENRGDVLVVYENRRVPIAMTIRTMVGIQNIELDDFLGIAQQKGFVVSAKDVRDWIAAGIAQRVGDHPWNFGPVISQDT